jgi:hypothetical protein
MYCRMARCSEDGSFPMRGVEEDVDVNRCNPLEESWWSLTGSRALNLSISTFTTAYFVNEERALH